MNINDFMVAAITVFIVMSIVSVFAIKLKRNDLADVIWGPGFLISGFAVLFYKCFSVPLFSINSRIICVLILVANWSIRLFFHIGVRTLRHREEDARYKKMRDSWGKFWALKTYFFVFMLQGFLMLLIALPIYIVISSPSKDLDVWSFLGIAIWVFGFVVETAADSQLTEFKKKPENKSKIMDEGLWSWSRHPNYFGEITQWWGIFLITVGLPQGWLAVLSPLAITFLILKVSGVTMLEKQMQNRPGYKEYQARTSMFILWPPKRT